MGDVFLGILFVGGVSGETVGFFVYLSLGVCWLCKG